MSKVTVNNLSSLQNETTALNVINGNDNKLAAAFDNTLSRDGTAPNQMGSNLDMNSNHILNLPEPSADNDPVRKIDLTNVSQITNLIHTASSSSVLIGIGTKTFTVPSGLGFQVGSYILIQQNGNTANYMGGRVTSYSGTTLVTNITAIGGSGTFSAWTIDISGAPGATGTTGAVGPQTNVFDTRTLAISSTIPGSVNVLRTNAYDTNYTPESGATFARLAPGSAFLDTWPTAGNIVGGTGYVNGTYFGITLSGGSGQGIFATVVVSGTSVVSVDLSFCPGNGFKIGDVLLIDPAFLGGSGSGFSYTVTAVSTPLASFVNAVDGSLWQYKPDKGCTHINQFGAIPDWDGVDAGTTNNYAAIQAALFFGGRQTHTNNGGGGSNGDVVKCGAGSYRLLHSTAIPLIVPNGVCLEGIFGTTLKFDNTWDPSTHCISVGNMNAHFANFNSGLKNLELFFDRNIAGSSNIYIVYSNNAQDGCGFENLNIYGGQRGCIKYEIGYGGASTVRFWNLNLSTVSVTPAVFFNVGTTIMDCRVWSVGAPSSGMNTTQNAINLQGNGGMYSFDGIHMEGYPNGFLINLIAGNNPQASFKNITGGFNLAYVFTLVSTNSIGNASFERCQVNNGSATGLVLNGQSGGTNRTTNILPKDGIVFFNP